MPERPRRKDRPTKNELHTREVQELRARLADVTCAIKQAFERQGIPADILSQSRAARARSLHNATRDALVDLADAFACIHDYLAQATPARAMPKDPSERDALSATVPTWGDSPDARRWFDRAREVADKPRHGVDFNTLARMRVDTVEGSVDLSQTPLGELIQALFPHAESSAGTIVARLVDRTPKAKLVDPEASRLVALLLSLYTGDHPHEWLKRCWSIAYSHDAVSNVRHPVGKGPAMTPAERENMSVALVQWFARQVDDGTLDRSQLAQRVRAAISKKELHLDGQTIKRALQSVTPAMMAKKNLH